MPRLTFFIPPLTLAQQIRTQEAHVIRGLSYLCTSQERFPHALDLLYTLGLSGSINVYNTNDAPLGLCAATDQALMEVLATMPYERAVEKMQSTFSLIKGLGPSRRDACIAALYHYRFNVYPLPRFERIKYMKPADSDKISPDVMQRLNMSLSSLQQAFDAFDPQMASHLRASHSLLISYPETTHLLDDNEIKLIINASERHVKTEIVNQVAKKASAGKKAKPTVDDL